MKGHKPGKRNQPEEHAKPTQERKEEDVVDSEAKTNNGDTHKGYASPPNKREAQNRKEKQKTKTIHLSLFQDEERIKGPTPFQQAVAYTDEATIVIDFAEPNTGAILSAIPSTWMSRPNGGALPAKFKQINWINIQIAKILNRQTHTLPFPANQTKIISPCPPYKKGAIIVGYEDAQETANITHLLATKGITTKTYRPQMQKVESSGWPTNLQPEDINLHINTFKIGGLQCIRTLRNSYKGEAQFLVPNYNINKLQSVTLPNGKPTLNWHWLKRLHDPNTKKTMTKCTNCFESGHRSTACKKERKCGRCGGVWHIFCKAEQQQCQWDDCNTQAKHTTYQCPSFADERIPIVFRPMTPTKPKQNPLQKDNPPTTLKPTTNTNMGSWKKPPTIPTQREARPLPASPSSPPTPTREHSKMTELTVQILNQNKVIKEQQQKIEELQKSFNTLTEKLEKLQSSQIVSTNEIKASLTQIQEALNKPTLSFGSSFGQPSADLDSTFSSYSQDSTSRKTKRKKNKPNLPWANTRASSPFNIENKNNAFSDDDDEQINTQLVDLFSQLLKQNYKQSNVPSDVVEGTKAAIRSTINTMHLHTIEKTNTKQIADSLHQNIQLFLPSMKKIPKTTILQELNNIVSLLNE